MFLVSCGILLIPRFLQVNKLDQRSRDLDKEIKNLEIQNKALETELRLLRDDPVYLEKVARKKFNKAKTGEVVYKVVTDKTLPQNENQRP